MNINIADGSNYFKGLLLLISMDRKISELEIQLMKRVGKSLGFEKEFCDTAISEILDNTHIEQTPPKFTRKEVATKFVKDGFAIAYADSEAHPTEVDWLKSTVEHNGLELEWFYKEREQASQTNSSLSRMEVDGITVQYS